MRIPAVRILLLLMFALLLLDGCKKGYYLSDKQVVLFQMDYMNSAWVSQHNGYFIDNEGNVLTYDNPDDWNFPNSNSIISEEELLENLSKCTRYEGIIPPDELEKFSKHIANIAASKVSAPKRAGADMGSLTYNCYQFDEGTLTYKSYLIKMEGDNTCENLNLYSRKVSIWLKEVGENISAR